MNNYYRTLAGTQGAAAPVIVGTLPASGTSVNSGAGSWIVGSGVTSITIQCWGGGGAGAGASGAPDFSGAGGAGGASAITTISVTPGQTIFYSVGAARTGTSGNAANGNDTWVNKTTNAAPASTADGALGGGGASAVGTSQGVGTTVTSVGTTIYAGGSGRVGGGAFGGGGGSSAGTSANGTSATDRFGAIAPAGGGNGGNAGTNNTTGSPGVNGSQPGGGGGGCTKVGSTTRNGGGGAAGRIILTY